MRWAATFREELGAHKHDAAWLLAKVQERPVRPVDVHGWRDDMAVMLCAAIAATHDKAAISEALQRRTDPYERQVLGQN